MTRRAKAVDHMWELTKGVTGLGSQTQTGDQENVARLLSEVETYTSSVAVLPLLAELVTAAYDCGRNSTKDPK